MLRITVSENPRTITFRLEGRLSSGAWLDELGECWRRATEGEHEPRVRVDLSEVTFIDAAGKASLADMHRKGAELVATDCLTKAIVAEITGDHAPLRARGRLRASGNQSENGATRE